MGGFKLVQDLHAALWRSDLGSAASSHAKLGHAARQDAAPPRSANTLFLGILQGGEEAAGAAGLTGLPGRAGGKRMEQRVGRRCAPSNGPCPGAANVAQIAS